MGMISFITPCVLPLVPVYLSILSGSSFDQLTGRGRDLTKEEQREIHTKVISNALMFILGFSMIFIISGVVAGQIGDFLQAFQQNFGAVLINWLLVIFGGLLLLLGMNMAGVWKPMFLNTEKRFQLQKGKFGLISSALVGAAFAFGWTPCIGPFLAVILGMAAESGNRLQGALLLATYSLGLAIPFFLSALSVNGLIAFSNKMKRHFDTLEFVVGTILIVFGLSLHLLGVYGVRNNADALGKVRGWFGGLEEFSSGLERSVSGTNTESNGAPEPMEVDEDTEVTFDDSESGE